MIAIFTLNGYIFRTRLFFNPKTKSRVETAHRAQKNMAVADWEPWFFAQLTADRE
jgi:hypothetical protein